MITTSIIGHCLSRHLCRACYLDPSLRFCILCPHSHGLSAICWHAVSAHPSQQPVVRRHRPVLAYVYATCAQYVQSGTCRLGHSQEWLGLTQAGVAGNVHSWQPANPSLGLPPFFTHPSRFRRRPYLKRPWASFNVLVVGVFHDGEALCKFALG